MYVCVIRFNIVPLSIQGITRVVMSQATHLYCDHPRDYFVMLKMSTNAQSKKKTLLNQGSRHVRVCHSVLHCFSLHPSNFPSSQTQVVMSQATHLYFDHPQEPDPEERGYYWATRFTPVRKVFGFMPDDLFANVDVERSGKPITREGLCKNPKFCVDLKKKENIIGAFPQPVKFFSFTVYPQ